MSKFNNKYRIESARAPWWDYGRSGAYFITICTKNREHYFGEINEGKMVLSPTGVIADLLWHEIPYHSQNVELDEFVVMPNHIHGILILNGNPNGGLDGHIVETGHALSLQYDQIDQINQIDQIDQIQSNDQTNPNTLSEPIIGNSDQINATENNYHPRFRNPGKNTVSSIIGGYKSAVTKHANRLEFPNGWQSRFHDHIIRDDDEYQRIKNYISNNISNWKNDKFY